jgi:CubicO group peptidase (beta-lactamase class C family)
MNKSMRILVICLLMTMVLAGCDKKPIIDEARQNEIDAFYEKVDRILSDRNFNGSVLVAKDDIIYLANGYGLSEENSEVKNQRETIYQIGSITKSFTAMAIMQLQEAGKLNVQDPIDKYFPNYPNDSKITIHHLLTHTSGIDHNPIRFSEFNEQMSLHNGIMDKNVVAEIMD